MDSIRPEKHMAVSDFQDKWEKLLDKAIKRGYESLTPIEKVWFNVQSLNNSIVVGGLISYYYNAPADRLEDCMKALEVLGADRMKAVLERMNRLFPSGVPRDTEARKYQIINSWPEGDEEFDDLLDEIEESASSEVQTLKAKLIEFIQKTGVGT